MGTIIGTGGTKIKDLRLVSLFRGVCMYSRAAATSFVILRLPDNYFPFNAHQNNYCGAGIIGTARLIRDISKWISKIC